MYFFPLMGKYTIYDKVFPVFKPFLSLGLFIKSAREVTYKPSVFLIRLAFNARICFTVCRVFFGQDIVLRHLYIGLAVSF